VVDAFLAAARGGDLNALLAVLDPDVVLRADAASGPTGVPQVVRGAADVSSGALRFSERARISRPALVDGRPGLVVAPAGHRVGALVFTIVGDVITEIEITGDAGALGRMEVAYLDG
jgi:RNA polymerase sigma-70 factor (ECF subfamily)